MFLWVPAREGERGQRKERDDRGEKQSERRNEVKEKKGGERVGEKVERESPSTERLPSPGKRGTMPRWPRESEGI